MFFKFLIILVQFSFIYTMAINKSEISSKLDTLKNTDYSNVLLNPSFYDGDHNYSNESEYPVEYEYNYSVHDENTGDIKSQMETRKGDIVQGYYELIEPDGYKRTVKYYVDKESGFKAIVQRKKIDFKIPAPEQNEFSLHGKIEKNIQKINYSPSTPIKLPSIIKPKQNDEYNDHAPIIGKLVTPLPVMIKNIITSTNAPDNIVYDLN